MGSDDLGVVLRRLEAVERRNRHLTRVLGAMVLAVIAWPMLVAADKQTTGKTIEARKIVIRDANGAMRAELATEPGGAPVLAFRDGKGGATMTLRGEVAAPIIELADGAGGSVWLSSSATGASLSLSKGKGEIELASRATGEPSIRLQDRDGKMVWHAP
jgi:hypothetical protein